MKKFIKYSYTIIKFFPENGGRYESRDIKEIKIYIDDHISGIEPNENSFNLKFNDIKIYPAYQPIKKIISYKIKLLMLHNVF